MHHILASTSYNFAGDPRLGERRHAAELFRVRKKVGIAWRGKCFFIMGRWDVFPSFRSGAFIVSVLTGTVGWRYAYYVSGAIYGVLFICMCLLMPDAPLQSSLCLKRRKLCLLIKIRADKEAAKIAEGNVKYKVSFRSIQTRLYVYVFCIWQTAFNFLYYSDYIATPFYLDEFFKIDLKTQGYVQLAMSLTAFFACFGWELMLPVYDMWNISWFKSRISLILMPLIVNCLMSAVIPFINALSGVITCLMLKSIVIASLFGGPS